MYKRSKERKMTFLDRLEPGINSSENFEFTLDEEEITEGNEYRNYDEVRKSKESKRSMESARPSKNKHKYRREETSETLQVYANKHIT